MATTGSKVALGLSTHQAARADGTAGIGLTTGEAEELKRILAHFARGAEPAPRTPGGRVRLLAQLAGKA